MWILRTGHWHAGEAPDREALRLPKTQLDIQYQRARQFQPEDFDTFISFT